MKEIILKPWLIKIINLSKINRDKLIDLIQRLKLKISKIIIINLTSKKYLQRFKITKIFLASKEVPTPKFLKIRYTNRKPATIKINKASSQHCTKTRKYIPETTKSKIRISRTQTMLSKQTPMASSKTSKEIWLVISLTIIWTKLDKTIIINKIFSMRTLQILYRRTRCKLASKAETAFKITYHRITLMIRVRSTLITQKKVKL